ncbi:MAG: hypothetical protein JWP25_8551 [Bradyrhizobium sp.]|nr:hypothetical protein [Bradyrhizobium sp.]
MLPARAVATVLPIPPGSGTSTSVSLHFLIVGQSQTGLFRSVRHCVSSAVDAGVNNPSNGTSQSSNIRSSGPKLTKIMPRSRLSGAMSASEHVRLRSLRATSDGRVSRIGFAESSDREPVSRHQTDMRRERRCKATRIPLADNPPTIPGLLREAACGWLPQQLRVLDWLCKAGPRPLARETRPLSRVLPH